MTIYKCMRPESPIELVELTPAGTGNYAYFTLHKGATVEQAVDWLAQLQSGQRMIGQTTVDGKTLLLSRGDRSTEQLVMALREHGAVMQPIEKQQGFEPWKLRGNLSNAGQVLQLLSAQYAKGGINGSVMGFAVTNLAANMTNVVFGAETMPDEHRTNLVKQQCNQRLAKYLPDGAHLPSVEVNYRKPSLDEQHEPLHSPLYNFLKRYSVTFGEIGLRYLGAMSLVVPINKWGSAAKELIAGKEIGEVYKTYKNGKDFIRYSGMAYLVGKTIALSSQVPDPFHPKAADVIDSFREDVAFKLSSAIEAGAALALAYEGLRLDPDKPGTPKLKFDKSTIIPAFMRNAKFTQRDWFGGIGGLLFTTGLCIRYFAPYGTREADMPSIYAHISEGLSKVPQDQLPQLVADTAAFLVEHFKDNGLEYSRAYHDITHNLYRYHDIMVPEPELKLQDLKKGAPSKDEAVARTVESSAGREPTTRISALLAQTERMNVPAHARAVQ